jgi:hypothetical protein
MENWPEINSFWGGNRVQLNPHLMLALRVEYYYNKSKNVSNRRDIKIGTKKNFTSLFK